MSRTQVAVGLLGVLIQAGCAKYATVHQAAAAGDVAEVKKHLRFRASRKLAQLDSYGLTPMHRAPGAYHVGTWIFVFAEQP